MSSTDPITTASLVVRTFAHLLEEVSGVKHSVFTPSLTVEAGLRLARTKKTSLVTEIKEQGRLLLYNRSNLRHIEGLGRKGINRPLLKDTSDSDNPTTKCFESVQVEFDVGFVFLSNISDDIDTFELLYLQENFPQRFTINLGDELGEFPFKVVWQPLDALEIVKDEAFTWSVSGSATLSGTFLLINDRTISKLIKDANFTITFKEVL